MTALTVSPAQPLRGRVRVPGDKSISHRALLLAALADGTSTIRGLSIGEDVARTLAATAAMGAIVDVDAPGNTWRVTGGELHEPTDVLDVGNSGTSIRLLAGFCAARPWLTVLAGDESVARRPMERVVAPLRAMGARLDGRDDGRYPPLVVRGGGLTGIDYTMPVASAQVKSAILLAGLAASGDTVVRQPAPTRAHTEELLAACGADIDVDGLVVRLRPSPVKPLDLEVSGDPSQAAFWVVAACVVPGSDLVVENVYVGPARVGFLDVLARMGAEIELRTTDHDAFTSVADIRVRHGELHGTEVAGAEIPSLIDEIPVLAVAAAVADGTTTFRDAGELAVKESNRVATMSSELAAMGGRVEPSADGLTVHGRARSLRGGQVRSHGDHRIAMAMAVAGLASTGPTVIEGWEAVATSDPGFEETLRRWG